jgi:hypothetical protein
MLTSLLGAVAGGLFRVLPELLKFLERKDERRHELNLLDKEKEIAQIKGEIAMRQTQANLMTTELTALSAALQEQGETARAAGSWVAAISALVRPAVTYAVVSFYFAVKLATFVLAVQQDGAWAAVLKDMWTEDDQAVLSLVLTFWFVGRVWERANK